MGRKPQAAAVGAGPSSGPLAAVALAQQRWSVRGSA